VWSKSIDGVWADDIPRPGVASLLDLSKIVLLEIVEVETLVVVPGHILRQRELAGAEVGTIVLITVLAVANT
jgi:hypothetical protein